jgi:hypothetical protein
MPISPSQNLPFPHMRKVTPSAPCRRTRLTKYGVDIIPVGYAWLDKEKLLPPVPAPQVQAGQD